MINVEDMRLEQLRRQRTRGSVRELPRVTGRQRARAQLPASGDELLATIGHELRNPLGAITAASEVLQLERPDAATVAEAHAVLGRQARLLGTILDSLQDLARARSGRITLERRALDLASLVRHACAAMVSAGDAAQDSIQLDLEPCWVDGDAARLQQAIARLVADALRACVGRQPVRVSLRAAQDSAVLQVRAGAAGAEPVPRRPGVGVLLALKLFEMHGANVQPGARGVTLRLRRVLQES